MSNFTDVAIIGAGPYGLSVAANLRARGVAHRIFGTPLRSWLDQMPQGMLLKSEGFATNLGDPERRLTLGQFCQEKNLTYADEDFPIPLDTLVNYGLEFQRRLVPHLERCEITAVERVPGGFLLKTDNGEIVMARAVVVAVGIGYFSHMPEELASLPKDRASHSADHADLSVFKGKQVTVVGGGASAIDLAGLLHEAGATVELVIRGPSLNIHTRRKLPRPRLEAIRHPMSTIGPGWRHIFCTKLPGIYHYLPQDFRVRFVKRSIPPAAGWFMRDRVEGKVKVTLRHAVKRAEIKDGRVELALVADDGTEQSRSTDHVIAATGYRYDLGRIPFLDPALVGQIRSMENTPVLSSNFQSSVPGLYFVGAITAYSFGPVVRFIAGAEFSARRLGIHLARAYAARRAPGTPVRQAG